MSTRGAFILFEGIDRCGKTTQCSKLIEALEAQQHRVVHLRFPYDGTETGKLLRAFLTQKVNMHDRAAHLMFSANRWECAKMIVDHLNSGTTIVCDRYAYSGVAFTAFKGYDLEWCRSPDRGLPAPDTVLYLQLSIEDAMKRGGFGQERYEKVEAQTIVKQIYEEKLRDETWQIFDANQSVDALHSQLLTAAQKAIVDARENPIGKMFDVGVFELTATPPQQPMGRKRLNNGGNYGTTVPANGDVADASTASTTAMTNAIEFNEQDPVSVFANLTLQGVVKENHGSRIVDCSFCRVHTPFGNLLADVAVSQANVYRLPKDGETVDLFFQFLNEGPFPPRVLENGDDVNLTLNACAWIVVQDVDTPIEAQSARDAWLAVAGGDCVIHVLSLASCREIFQLVGHTDDIVALESCAGARELLLSLSSKGVVRVWNVINRSCIAEYATDATCIAVASNGAMFYTGHVNGVVRTWLMPLSVAVDTQMFNDESAMSCVKLKRRIIALRTARNALVVLDRRPALSVLVDSTYDIAVDSGTPIVARSVHHEWNVPQINEQCSIDVSPDGLRVLLGDQAGDMSLFDVATGACVGLKKAQSRLIALKRALWSIDCRDVVCVGDAPFVWRWKFMHPEERRELTEEYTQTIAMREIEAQVRAEHAAAKQSTATTAATTSMAPPPPRTNDNNETNGSVLPAVKRSKKRLH